MLATQANDLKLLDRLAEAEGFEQRTATAEARPAHRIALMWNQQRMKFTLRHVEARSRRDLDLAFEELAVGVGHAASDSGYFGVLCRCHSAWCVTHSQRTTSGLL